jgi:energy-coupling factor transporter ATP-binding protein EcfA2
VTESGPPVGLLTVLVRLRQCLVDSPLRLAAADAAEGGRERSSILAQLDDYVVPRLVQLDAPLLAVVGGSTGAGKSTLVNSLVGMVVSPPGVLRPTTRSAVLVHNPADTHWFGADRLLPDLARTDRASDDPGGLHLLGLASLPAGLALLDAPDVDSVEAGNRVLAAQLLGAADLWLFVTSAARYADQVPWDYLKAAAARSTAVAVVLDRTDPAVIRAVRSHLAEMMAARGLGDSQLFTVAEVALSDEGLLPAAEVRPIREWLDSLAEDSAARTAVIRQTLEGAIASLPKRTGQVASALTTQEQLSDILRSDVVNAYREALAAVEDATQDGTMLRGEVLARWQEFVGTSDLVKALENRVGRLRDRVVSVAKGAPPPAQTLTVAIESGLHMLIVEYAETAAERAALAWQALPAGASLLDASGHTVGRASRGLAVEVERTIRDWQGSVLDMVRSEGANRRTTARYLAYGVNGLGVALMMVIFASTAGVTGAEIGVAGGTAVVAQKILEAVFGDQAVRRLAVDARKDLHARVEGLWAQEQARFFAVLDEQQTLPGTAERLRALGRELADARLAWEHV